MTPLIELKNAAFGYHERAIISGINLSINPGEVVALLGPNGSGKSTLLRGILGLTEHLGGEVLLFGVPREQFTEHTRLGYVPQKHTLSASVRATVREIVDVGRVVRRPWYRPASRTDAEHVSAAIETVGLADRSGAEVAALSGGQQRRVLIARALAGRPDVFLMDEPTAGVDHANQVMLATVLGRLAADGTSMLIVTHELEALEDVVTRVVCVDSGGIDFDGTWSGYQDHVGAHPKGDGHHHDEHHDANVILGEAPLDPTPKEAHHG